MWLNGSKWPRIGSLVCSLCLCGMAQAEWVRATDTAMTTRIELEFWAENDTHKAGLKDDVLAVFHAVDREMSRYKPSSELSRVNRQAAEQPVAVSDPLFEVFSRALDVSRLSQGAFDISFASVGYLYDYRAGIRPDEGALRTGLSLVDYRAIVLDAEQKTIFYRKPGVVSDLGGIAKGYAVDLGIEVLRKAGVRHARLSAGGDMRLLGDKRGKPWVVGIRDPRSEKENAVLLPLSDVSVSTSGDYERFFIDEEGDRVHHILSPATGRPAEGIQSVTILGPDTLTTDGLSTAVFVLGVEQGLALIDQLPGIDAIIIDGKRTMHYSDGLGPGQ